MAGKPLNVNPLRPTPNTTLIPVQQSTVAGGDTSVIASVSAPRDCVTVVKGRFRCYDATQGKGGYFEVTAAVKNVNGTTTVVGTASIITLKDDSDFAVTVAANDTDDTLEISGAADSANDTLYEGELWVESYGRAL